MGKLVSTMGGSFIGDVSAAGGGVGLEFSSGALGTLIGAAESSLISRLGCCCGVARPTVSRDDFARMSEPRLAGGLFEAVLKWGPEVV